MFQFLRLLFLVFFSFLAISNLALFAKVIGITQITSHQSLDAVQRGVMDVLKAERPEDSIIFANAQGDVSTAVQIAQKFVSDHADVIVAISTPSAQSAIRVASSQGIPVVFASVTDPVGAKLVGDLKHPGGNVTGVRNNPPMEKQLDLIKRVLPGVKNIGIAINYGEDNNVFLLNKCQEVAKKLGLTIITAPVDGSSGVATAANHLVNKVDAIFLFQDNTVASALPALLKVTGEHRVPVFSAFPEAVEQGALMAYAFDEYEIGRQAGKIVLRILSGEKPGDIAVEDPQKLDLTVNEKVAEALGVKVDPKLLK